MREGAHALVGGLIQHSVGLTVLASNLVSEQIGVTVYTSSWAFFAIDSGSVSEESRIAIHCALVRSGVGEEHQLRRPRHS